MFWILLSFWETRKSDFLPRIDISTKGTHALRPQHASSIKLYTKNIPIAAAGTLKYSSTLMYTHVLPVHSCSTTPSRNPGPTRVLMPLSGSWPRDGSPGYNPELPCPRVRPRRHATQRARSEIFKLSLVDILYLSFTSTSMISR